jgi:hypothetical protein
LHARERVPAFTVNDTIPIVGYHVAIGKLPAQHVPTVIRDLKTLVHIPGNNRLICLLLAVLLAVGNVTFSAHVSGHAVSDNSFCSLCVHPGGPDTVITSQSGPLYVGAVNLTLHQGRPAIRYLTVVPHARQSRAPPRIV